MPMYPFENMPTSLIRHSVAPARINENFNELKLNGKLKQEMVAEHTILSPGENSDTTKGLYISPTMHGSSTLSKQVQIFIEMEFQFIVCSMVMI